MQVTEEIKMQTINRGTKRFIISQTSKGYFAHELGGKTREAIIFNWNDIKAYRLNPNRRHGNQYGNFWKPKPFKTLQEARNQIIKEAYTNTRYF